MTAGRSRFHRWLTVAAAVLAAFPARAEDEAEVNLAPNPGFELPAGPDNALPELWQYFTTKNNGLGITTSTSRNGRQCLKIAAQKVPEQFQGLVTEIDVQEGEKYSFIAWLTNNRDDPLKGSAFGELVVEWKDDQGKEISRDTSRSWGSNLTRMRWQDYEVSKAKAPKKAVRALFGIHLNEGERESEGSFFVDDVVIRKE